MKRLNKKGFTLVELLAVIVVLAVIMVIATQVIGNVMAKSRADSYASTVKAIRKGAETACTMDGYIDEENLKANVEYSDVDVTISDGVVTVEPTEKGKFDNMDASALTDDFTTATYEVEGTTITITTSCSE